MATGSLVSTSLAWYTTPNDPLPIILRPEYMISCCLSGGGPSVARAQYTLCPLLSPVWGGGEGRRREGEKGEREGGGEGEEGKRRREVGKRKGTIIIIIIYKTVMHCIMPTKEFNSSFLHSEVACCMWKLNDHISWLDIQDTWPIPTELHDTRYSSLAIYIPTMLF